MPVQLPTWLGLAFVTAYTMGYRRPILAGHDDSSIVIRVIKEHQHCLRRMRQRDLPSSLLLQLNFVTVHRRMCHPILDGCDGMAVALPSSLYIVEEH